MTTIVHPFTVHDDNLLPEIQAVAPLIPAAIAGAEPTGACNVWSSQRFGAPTWAYGYSPNGGHTFLNPQRHVAAHEYAHSWWYRHGRQVGGNAALRALVDHPELIGKIESAHYTNRLSEAYAHAFAAAVGHPDGVSESFFRVKIPPANYGALLDLMGKAAAVVAAPTHIYRRTLRVALRLSPQVSAPAVAWAAYGDVIRAADSLSGGSYVIPLADGSRGCQSSAWLVVSARNGLLLSPLAYTAELAWASLPAEPLPPIPAPPPSQS